MRRRHAVLVALLLVLAGCSSGFVGSPADGAATPTATAPTTATADAPPDPASDRLGWEAGYWANETLALDRSDGLNDTEVEAVVARAMARVETVRGLEFESTVPVELVSRAEFRNGSTGSRDYPAAFRRFDNAKFEALFLVGEDRDALAVQQSNRGSSVAGYYSPGSDEIVVIYPGDTPDLPGESTLSHELVHALQDQQFGLGDARATTRDERNAQNGLIEGEANLVQRRYTSNCGAAWSCLPAPGSGGGGGGDFHLGIYVLNFFPYSDGPGFVAFYEARGGWDRIDAMHDRYPASSEQVIHPEKYAVDRDPPTAVELPERARNGWERVRPPGRAAYATVGQAGMTAMFAYTLYDDYREGGVVARDDFLNIEDGEVDRRDPFRYDLAYTDGWDGDRLHVYRKGDETAYVWRSVWDSPAEAREFAAGYRALLDHWGASEERDGVYRVREGPFADSFRLTVDGDTVTVVNAPETRALRALAPN
jgi:hypothetical protein